MIDDIINTIKDQIGGDLMEKFGLNAGQKDKALDITKETISDNVSKEAMGGRMSGRMNLFSSNQNNSEGSSA